MSKNGWDKAKTAWRVRPTASSLMASSPMALSKTNAHQPFIATLGTAEQFLVSALRLWGNGRGQNTLCCCRNLLRNGFQAAGLSAMAFEQFDRAVGLIDAAMAHAEITGADPAQAAWIMPLSSHVVAPDEVRFLRALMLCQHDRISDAIQVLGMWLPPAATRVVLGDLAAFAKTCATVGLVLAGRAALYDSHDTTMVASRLTTAFLH